MSNFQKLVEEKRKEWLKKIKIFNYFINLIKQIYGISKMC